MKITEVRFQHVNSGNTLKAYASITFDDCFVVHNVKIFDGAKGLYLLMPSRKLKNGEFKNIAHPINSEFRDKLIAHVLEAYEKSDKNDVLNIADDRE